MRRMGLVLAAAAMLAARGDAQSVFGTAAGRTVKVLGGVMMSCPDSTGYGCTAITPANPLPVGARETFTLATANTPAAAVTVFGGDYILSQTCTAYGTLTLQVLGPDGVTYLTLASYTTSDTGSGHGFALGSYAKVKVTVSGTTGCYALLSRVPA